MWTVVAVQARTPLTPTSPNPSLLPSQTDSSGLDKDALSRAVLAQLERDGAVPAGVSSSEEGLRGLSREELGESKYRRLLRAYIRCPERGDGQGWG